MGRGRMADERLPRYDQRTGRYRDPNTGRFIASEQVWAGVDRTISQSSDRMAAVSARLRSGSLTVDAWQREMQALVKQAHVASALAAHGGRAQMDPAAWGHLGARVREQYQYLRAFAQDIIDGRQVVNGRLDLRARQYAQSARQTFNLVDQASRLRGGATLERNVLSAAEHCAGCLQESARGWVPVGSLSRPGTRECRTGCRCRLDYRQPGQVEAAA